MIHEPAGGQTATSRHAVTERPRTGRPLARDSSIPRSALVDRLCAAAPTPAIALCAPAGYGKSTVLLQWSQVDPRPFAWVTLDALDDDPSTFVQHLVSALSTIEAVEPVDGELSSALTAAEPRFSSTVLPLLARSLQERTVPFVLVLDDLGEVTSTPSLRLLGVVLANLPEGSTVACATRTAPPLPIRQLRVRRQVLELGRADLAMTLEESSALLRSLGLDDQSTEARSLMGRVEGWPAFLYLASSATIAGSPGVPGGAGAVRAAGGVDTHDLVADYLFDEILARLDDRLVHFLLETSVLSELSGPLCDAVRQAEGSTALLHGLARTNQLVIPVAGPRGTYRYHGLFGEFLRSEAGRAMPDRLGDLHRRASRWYAAEHQPDQAVRHARAAGDMDLLGEIVWSHAERYLSHGRGDVLSTWIEGIGERQVARSCGVALAAGWVAAQRGDTAAMTRSLATARARLAEVGPARAATFGPGVAVLEATVGAGGLADIAERCSSAIDADAPDSPWLALAHFLRGVALVLLGHEVEGRDHLQRGESLAHAFDTPGVRAHCLAALGGLATAVGDTSRGTALVKQARGIVAEHGLEHVPTLAPVLTASALVLALEGRPDDAEREALTALRLTSLIAGLAPWFAVQGRLQLARTFTVLGDRQRALMLVDEATSLVGPVNDSPVLERLLRDTTALVRGVAPVRPPSGASTLTTAELRVLQYLPSHLTTPQIAQELYVSRHTVKSQVKAIYLKLGASSRRDAVARARAMGLLPAV